MALDETIDFLLSYQSLIECFCEGHLGAARGMIVDVPLLKGALVSTGVVSIVIILGVLWGLLNLAMVLVFPTRPCCLGPIVSQQPVLVALRALYRSVVQLLTSNSNNVPGPVFRRCERHHSISGCSLGPWSVVHDGGWDPSFALVEVFLSGSGILATFCLLGVWARLL